MERNTRDQDSPKSSPLASNCAMPRIHHYQHYDSVRFPSIAAHEYKPVYLDIDFKRTVRVADNNDVSKLPPGFDSFPLYDAEDFPNAPFPPEDYFMPMYQREAMWIRFKSDVPFAIKILIGGVNAISGEPEKEDRSTDLRRSRNYKEGRCIQDYVVTPQQPWLDGVADQDGTVRQFVTCPLGSGYSVEKQITGEEAKGGIQIEVTPDHAEFVPLLPPGSDPTCVPIHIKTQTGHIVTLHLSLDSPVYVLTLHNEQTGVPVDRARFIFRYRQLEMSKTLRESKIEKGSVVYLICRLSGGDAWRDQPGYASEQERMGIAAGGRIKQSIVRDPTGPRNWDSSRTATARIHIINSEAFKDIVGDDPPESPIRARTYEKLGLPYFDIYDEKPSGIRGNFDGIKSVNQLDKETSQTESVKTAIDEVEESQTCPVVGLNERGERLPFRHVKDLEEQMEKMLRISDS